MKSSALKVHINKSPQLSAVTQDFNDDYCERSPYSAGPEMILPNLYLGSSRAAEDLGDLERLGIQCVVNVAKEVAMCETPKSIEDNDVMFGPNSRSSIKRFKFEWSHNEDLLPVIEEPIDLLQSYLENGIPVLVHCLQGVSRSPALIIGYIMKTKRIPFLEAYQIVKARSPSISPNVSLISHLVHCESQWLR